MVGFRSRMSAAKFVNKMNIDCRCSEMSVAAARGDDVS